MKLIVGLGNPGSEYAATRHNVGFMATECLAGLGLDQPRSRFHASVLESTFEGEKLLLMQPITYMNRSGQAVGEALRFFKADPADLLIIVDETALPIGTIRLRPRGSPGGHNGLADISRALATDDYPRLAIGVGEPIVNDQRIAKRDYVLGRFTDEQLADVRPAIERAADAAWCWAAQGIDAAMNRYNVRDNSAASDPTPANNDNRSESDPSAADSQSHRTKENSDR